MKGSKKILTGILAAVVCLIWGKVIFDIVMATKDGGTEFQMMDFSQSMEEIKLEEFDYEVNADYRDPFLGIVKTKKKTTPIVRQKPKVEEKKEVVSMVKWPKITYKGLIKNKNSNKELAMLNINGKEVMLKSGEEIGAIKLIATYTDSVVLAQNEELRTFTK